MPFKTKLVRFNLYLWICYLLIDITSDRSPTESFIRRTSSIHSRLRIDGKVSILVEPDERFFDDLGFRREIVVAPGQLWHFSVAILHKDVEDLLLGRWFLSP